MENSPSTPSSQHESRSHPQSPIAFLNTSTFFEGTMAVTLVTLRGIPNIISILRGLHGLGEHRAVLDVDDWPLLLKDLPGILGAP